MRDSTVCYIEKDGCWLMMHRIKKDGDLNYDKWIGVGGGLEEGESPVDCAIRETFEETGLKLVLPEYRGLVSFCMLSGGNMTTEQMHVFSCSQFEGTVRDYCDEGDLEWVKIDEVFNLPIWEGDKIFLHLLLHENRFFLLKLNYDNNRLIGQELSFGGRC